MKTMKNSFSKVAAVLLTFMAVSAATSACHWFCYQPEEPKCLREE